MNSFIIMKDSEVGNEMVNGCFVWLVESTSAVGLRRGSHLSINLICGVERKENGSKFSNASTLLEGPEDHCGVGSTDA